MSYALDTNNYFDNGDAKKGSFGFSLFTTSFVNNVPTTITNGAAGLTLDVVNTGSLVNRASLRLQKTGAINTQGQGLISRAFRLNRADLARVLRWSFDYERASGTIDASGTSTNSFEVWIFDVQSNTWIQPSGFRSITQTTLSGQASGEFQTLSTATEIRLAIIYRQTDTNTWSMIFDFFNLSRSVVQRGAVITEWQSYTPTFQGFGTPTNVNFRWRRVGSNLEIEGYFVSGVSTAVEARIGLPAGLVISGSQLTAPIDVVGTGYLSANGIGTEAVGVPLHMVAQNGDQHVVPGFRSSTGGNFVGRLANTLVSSGQAMGIEVNVPIAGWGSNQILSQDSETRPVSAYATRSTTNQTFAVGGGTFRYYTPFLNAFLVDTHSQLTLSGSDTFFRIPVSGIYDIEFGARFTASVATTVQLLIELNGSSVTNATALTGSVLDGGAILSTVDTDGRSSVAKVTRRFNAGDVVRPQLLRYGNNSLDLISGFSYFSVKQNTGSQQIAASDFVGARASSTSGQSLVTNTYTIMQATTISQNTHGSLAASGVFTVPARGTYLVTGVATFSGNSTGRRQIIVFRDGVAHTNGALIQASTASPVSVNVFAQVEANAGQTIDVRAYQESGVSLSLTTGSSDNVISFARIGS